MTQSLELTKKVEQVGLQLSKRGISKAPIMRVGVAIDISGSMGDEFADGSVQAAVDQLTALGVTFDDNGELECWAFDTRSHRAPAITAADYGKYIGTRRGQGKFGHWPNGGTNYAPVLKDMVETLAPLEKKGFLSMMKQINNIPAMALFITDGEPGDASAAERIIADATKNGNRIYFQLIGVGNDCRFTTLKRLADQYDNCGFVQFTSMKLSDEQMMAGLFTDELAAFIKRYERASA